MAKFTNNLKLEMPEKSELYDIDKFNANSMIIDSIAHNSNLLENPFFTVNQRGVDSWTTGYGVDRWRGNLDVAQSLSINSNHILTIETHFASMEAGIEQPIAKTYGGKFSKENMTASVMLSDGSVYSFTFNYDSTTAWADSASHGGLKNGGLILSDWNVKVGSDSPASSRKYFRLYSNKNGARIEIKALKLEYGNATTLENDAEPDYQTELAKCQRYYQKVNVAISTYGATTSGGTFTTIVETVPYIVSMRTVPTVTISGRNNEALVSSVTVNSTYTDSFVVQIIPNGTGFVRTRFVATMDADL